MLNKQSGMAYLEIIPLIVLMMLLLKYTFGFFGIVHTGILNTIAARNYSFETFRHRANLNYFRTIKVQPEIAGDKLTDNRYHSNIDEAHIDDSNDPQAWATVRSVSFPATASDKQRNQKNIDYHNTAIMNEKTLAPGKRYQQEESGSDPVWVRERYGICLTASCGG